MPKPLAKGEKPKMRMNLYTYTNQKKREAKKPMEPWELKDNGVEHIKNEATWKVWKKMMLEMRPKDHYEAAVFLYCILNE